MGGRQSQRQLESAEGEVFHSIKKTIFLIFLIFVKNIVDVLKTI